MEMVMNENEGEGVEDIYYVEDLGTGRMYVEIMESIHSKPRSHECFPLIRYLQAFQKQPNKPLKKKFEPSGEYRSEGISLLPTSQ